MANCQHTSKCQFKDGKWVCPDCGEEIEFVPNVRITKGGWTGYQAMYLNSDGTFDHMRAIYKNELWRFKVRAGSFEPLGEGTVETVHGGATGPRVQTVTAAMYDPSKCPENLHRGQKIELVKGTTLKCLGCGAEFEFTPDINITGGSWTGYNAQKLEVVGGKLHFRAIYKAKVYHGRTDEANYKEGLKQVAEPRARTARSTGTSTVAALPEDAEAKKRRERYAQLRAMTLDQLAERVAELNNGQVEPTSRENYIVRILKDEFSQTKVAEMAKTGEMDRPKGLNDEKVTYLDEQKAAGMTNPPDLVSALVNKFGISERLAQEFVTFWADNLEH